MKFDHFLDINCEYLDPNLIDCDFFKEDSSQQLSIFQNNIRSLNKNFHLVEELFVNCGELPDILAFSETKLNENTTTPSLQGYSFIHADSSSACGGVGVFIRENIEYSVRNDLNLNTQGCEDIWFEIKVRAESPDASRDRYEKVVIGTIYRHPSAQYQLFTENLCTSIEILNRTKTKYIYYLETLT